jgi:hypothetical protein
MGTHWKSWLFLGFLGRQAEPEECSCCTYVTPLRSLGWPFIHKLHKSWNNDSQVGNKGLKIAPSEASFDLVTSIKL